MAQFGGASPHAPIDVILHTLGGDAMAAEMVADALKRTKAAPARYVPYLAMSAGTMIALAAEELYMGPIGNARAHRHALLGLSLGRLEAARKTQGAETDKRPIESDTMYMLAYLAEKRARARTSAPPSLLNKKLQEARRQDHPPR